MQREFASSESYMGFSGPLVYIYEQLLFLSQYNSLRQGDEFRARALCEAEGNFEPTEDELLDSFHRQLFTSMRYIEDRIVHMNGPTIPTQRLYINANI